MFNLYRKTWAAVGFILCLFSVVYAYSDGNGTVAEPYQIASVSDWNDLMKTSSDWNKYFIMTADVNLQGIALTPVGNSGENFTGVLNGNNHIICNAYINGPTSDYIGLFGYVGTNGQIHNLGVENVNIIGRSYVSGLVGYNDGNLTACYAIGKVTGSGDNVGGFCGTNHGLTIINCYSTGTVTTHGYNVGGFCGSNNESTITNCYSTGIVNGTFYSDIGGFCGYNNASTITNCYSAGEVNATGDVGGFCGHNNNGSTITNCYSTATVTGGKGGSPAVGGLCGVNQSSTITNCYSTGAVTGFSEIGGFCGRNYDAATIANCYSSGVVTGNSYIGGFCGCSFNASTITTNCYSTGAVAGNSYVGGLVGNIGGGSVATCYSAGAVDGNSNVGGLIGYKSAGNVDVNSFWDVNTSDCNSSAGGTGKTTAQMQDVNTFLNAGWDFTTPIWKISNGNYPKLDWQEMTGDFVSPEGVGPEDLAFFAQRWLQTDCAVTNDCDGTDIYTDGTVNLLDFALFAENWLQGL